jgi:spore germination protein KC
MTARKRRLAISLTLAAALTLSGCWDRRELDTLFITTGIALDAADEAGRMDITLQVSKTQARTGDSGRSGSQDETMLLFKTDGHSLLEAMMAFSRNSSRTLLLQHNQVLVMGAALAEQGIGSRIDIFLRERSTRMEVPVIIAENRAADVLSAKLEQERLSGMYLSRMIQNLASVSPYYQVRMLDFASRLLDETTAPVAPLVSVAGEEDRQEIRMAGLAVFKGDKLAGRLSNDETLGYIWAMGSVDRCEVVSDTDEGRAVFQIIRMDCDRALTLREDGGVRAKLSVSATLNVGELQGFEDIEAEALLPLLAGLAQAEIRKRITDTFEIARRLDADIYAFGTSVQGKYPKAWKRIKPEWDSVFSDIEFTVQAEARIPSTGQILDSLRMETDYGKDR